MSTVPIIRADTWSDVTRLYLPIAPDPLGSANSIAQRGTHVNPHPAGMALCVPAGYPSGLACFNAFMLLPLPHKPFHAAFSLLAEC